MLCLKLLLNASKTKYMLFSWLNINLLMQYQQYKYMGIQLDQSWRAHEPVSVLKPLDATYHSASLFVTCISLLDGLLWISEGSNVVLIFKLPPDLTCLLSINSLNMKTRSQDWVPLKTTKYRTEWKETTQQWVLPAKRIKAIMDEILQLLYAKVTIVHM